MEQKPPPSSINDDLSGLLAELGIPLDYGRAPPRPRFADAVELVEVGPNLLGRMQRLTPLAADSWFAMQADAEADSVQLLLVSGFRSVVYQADLIRNKLAAGQSIDEILTVNAAPGFSQHHAGEALDIASPGTRPLTEEFASSEAFAWLVVNAEKYGFSMTYPRGNAAGFIYEPWHWALNVV